MAGGHTEITPAVTQPVICGFMLGEAPTGHTVSASGAKPGDAVILTKGIAIEGTSILANECRDALTPSRCLRYQTLMLPPRCSLIPASRCSKTPKQPSRLGG